jgi:hypothetical protein
MRTRRSKILKKCGLLYQATGFISGNALFPTKFQILLALLKNRKIKSFFQKIRILGFCLQGRFTTTLFLPVGADQIHKLGTQSQKP